MNCIEVFSIIPIDVKEDQRISFAIAINELNNKAKNAFFAYDIIRGRIRCTITYPYNGNNIGKKDIAEMIDEVMRLTEKYSGLLEKLHLGEFLESHSACRKTSFSTSCKDCRVDSPFIMSLDS